MSAAAINQDLLEAAVGRLGEDNLTEVRKNALLSFAESGFPTARQENWRYTNLNAATELSNLWLEAAPDSVLGADVDIERLSEEVDAHWIVVSNGIVHAEALSELQIDGVSVTTLSESTNSVNLHIDDPLSSFNASLLRDGLLISIAEDAKIEKPIGLLLSDDATSTPGLSQSRILIDVGRNARVSFVELYKSDGENEHLANSVMQLELAAGARADIVRIQARDPQHMQIGQLLAQLRDGATLNFSSIDVGGKLIRNDVVVKIAGPDATANISGVYLADGRQHIDNHILVDHQVGPARSMQDYRGIIGGRARCVFNGKALVRAGADGTDAEQSNHNLLLSDKAEIDTKPELEIFADDVKCAHGTTVGQLDEKSIFYLRSRGLSLEQAKILLTRAFAGQILKQLPIEGVRNFVNQLIEEKLDRLTGVEGA